MRAAAPDSPSFFDPASSDGPDLRFENQWTRRGLIVCGCDEAGRGPLAGPVTAAAVVLDTARIPDGLNDSKKLTEKQRAHLFEAIVADHAVSVVSLNAAMIDQLNIRGASLEAMARAVNGLPLVVDHVLVDGNAVPDGLKAKATAIVKGDARSLSIAAASIVAKVMRDRQMVEAHALYPAYGFDGHKGYPSPTHRELLAKHGPCPLHRRSFRPVAKALERFPQRSK